MKKHITLVFEFEENDGELEVIREMFLRYDCRAWSLDHELLRIGLLRQAIEAGDLKKALEYINHDGVIDLLPELEADATLEKLRAIRNMHEALREAKSQECKCSNLALQHEGGCQCDRGKQIKAYEHAILRLTASLKSY